jgi:hypothetical protein
MIGNMVRNVTAVAAFLTVSLLAVFSVGCGVSSTGPDGSKHDTMTGLGPSGYPGGEPKDAGSPALASSSEAQYSRPEPAAK